MFDDHDAHVRAYEDHCVLVELAWQSVVTPSLEAPLALEVLTDALLERSYLNDSPLQSFFTSEAWRRVQRKNALEWAVRVTQAEMMAWVMARVAQSFTELMEDFDNLVGPSAMLVEGDVYGLSRNGSENDENLRRRCREVGDSMGMTRRLLALDRSNASS